MSEDAKLGKDSPFTLRGVGDVIVKNVDQYQELNVDRENREIIFLRKLTDFLADDRLVKSYRRGGAYLNLYFPESGGEQPPIVVKVFDDSDLSTALTGLHHRLVEHTNGEFQRFLDQTNTVFFHDKQGKLKFDDLNVKEKLLVVSAWEHQIHEELFNPYVVPAVFVSFIAKEDVVEDEPFIPADTTGANDYWLKWAHEKVEELRQTGMLTDDGKEILIKSGQVVYVMVQNYMPDLSNSIFRLPEEYPISLSIVSQLEDFISKIERGIRETGYYPDPSMDHDQSQNLKLTRDGKLVLIDTNSIRKGGDNWDINDLIARLKRLVNKFKQKLSN